MKKLLLVITSGIFALGCSNAARPVAENVNTSTVASTPEKSQTAIAHSLENQQPPTNADPAGKSKWKQSGDPIDTKAFDTAIASAELNLRKKPDDAADEKDAFGGILQTRRRTDGCPAIRVGPRRLSQSRKIRCEQHGRKRLDRQDHNDIREHEPGVSKRGRGTAAAALEQTHLNQGRLDKTGSEKLN